MEIEHFACTACGKCCNTSPETTVLEAIALGDVFVASLVYKLSRVPRQGNEVGSRDLVMEGDFAGIDREVYTREVGAVVRRAGVRVGAEPGWDVFLTLTSRPWTYASARACPALDAASGHCKVHERRPVTCKTVPISYDVPDALLVPAYRAVVMRGKERLGYACDTSSAAPELLRDGALVNDEYRAAREEGVKADELNRALAERLLRSKLLPNPREILTAMGRGSQVSVSFFGAAIEAHLAGLVDEPSLLRFFEAQELVIAREVDAAMARKIKSERDMTTQLRKLGDTYAKLRADRLARGAMPA